MLAMHELTPGQMKAMGVQTVVAVDVENRDNSMFIGCDPYTSLSGWRLVWESCKLWGRRRKFPSRGDVMSGLSYISHSRQIRVTPGHRDGLPDFPQSALNDANVDIYLRPPVQQFALLDYDKFDTIVATTYEYASAALREWKAARAPPVTRTLVRRNSIRARNGESFLTRQSPMVDDTEGSPSLSKVLQDGPM